MVSWDHLELADLFPAYFERCKLQLPPAETDDMIPDIINEALWNIDHYRRLQRANGGVGGGVESTSHPRPGEASWQESLLLGTFSPDPETSYRYAACAAKAARLLAKYDARLAETYRASALKAWDWAEANADRVIAAELKLPDSRAASKPEALRAKVANMRALAAVALYRLTGIAVYHDRFKQSTLLGTDDPDPGKQLRAIFSYACVADAKADANLKREAIAWFEQAAKDSIKFASENAFQVTTRIPQLPLLGYVGYYTVPETTLGAVLPRAHYLTGKREYLAGAVAAANFSAGANPMNITFTTGVGHDYPRHPLHIDSLHAGIAPPRGITVYGINDPARQSGDLDWCHTWYLGEMKPSSRTWPATEFYVDLGNWPPCNEYTVHQTIGPTSYYWGYLAARGE